MRQLLAWVTSFTRKDQLVNQAVRQLAEIAQQKAELFASDLTPEELEGYRRARLRQTVREYVDSLRQQRPESSRQRQQLLDAILDRLAVGENISSLPAIESCEVPRQAA